MSVYAKVFATMYDGTLAGDWRALVTFQQFLVLCDQQGVVDMTPQAISARTGIPMEILEPGITSLEQPDQFSRTPDCEGRRIERLDTHRPWGWRIVNYRKYRELVSAEQKRAADRERISQKRATERQNSGVVATCRDVSQSVATVAHAEAEAEAEAEEKKNSRARARQRASVSEFHQQVIDAYHTSLPDLPRVKGWSERRQQALNARVAERVRDGKPADTVDYWTAFFDHVGKSDFLCGRTGNFRCDLPWLLGPENFLKVIEGRYANARRSNGEARVG
jgi:hypothetical protein